MVNLLAFRTVWTGFAGAPGYTTFHVREDTGDPAQVQSWADNIHTFWDALKGTMPNEVHLDINGIVQKFDIDTGQLVGTASVSPPAQVVGLSTATYSGVSGGVITWSTGQFRNGREVRGRTFLVPLAGEAYSATGSLTPSVQTTIQSAAVAMVDAEPQPLSIYSRPTAAQPVGALNAVSAVDVPALTAVLRSRRD